MFASRINPVAIVGILGIGLLAVFLGMAAAEPLNFSNLFVLMFVATAAFLPFLIKHHHALVICCWNAVATLVFLPGKLPLPAVMTLFSLALLVFHITMNRRYQYPNVKVITLPLVALVAVVLFTIFINGGMRSLTGGLWGVKRYLNVAVAIGGYFAITAFRGRSIKQKKILAALFFLSGVTYAIGDLLVMSGLGFGPLMGVFTSLVSMYNSITLGGFVRYAGIGWAAMAVANTILLCDGIGGTLKSQFGLRLLLLISVLSLSLIGGHRAAPLLMGLIIFFLFVFEGKFRGLYMLGATAIVIVAFAALYLFAPRLPLSFQRAISFLPVEVHPDARRDAANTLEWRFLMWKVAWPDVGRYFWQGRGYLYSGSDYYLTEFGSSYKLYDSYEFALVDGTYHNGFFTVAITFGVYGFLIFLWFCGGVFYVLWKNYCHGIPEFAKINTFLIAYFSARFVFYFSFYGQFDTDLAVFTGIAGMSVFLNDGVAVDRSKAVLQDASENATRLPEPRNFGPGSVTV